MVAILLLSSTSKEERLFYSVFAKLTYVFCSGVGLNRVLSPETLDVLLGSKRKNVRSMKETRGGIQKMWWNITSSMTNDSNFNSANSNFNQKNLPFLSSTGFGNRQSPENDSAGPVSHRLWVQVHGMFTDRGWPKDLNKTTSDRRTFHRAFFK